MSYEINTMAQLSPGQWGTVKSIGFCGGLERRLRDMGLCEGCQVGCVRKSPLGDPTAYEIRGAVIAIRESEAREVGLAWG